MADFVLGILAAFFIVFILFLILREVMCWYWKVNRIVSLLEAIQASLYGPGRSDRSSAETSALTPKLFPDMEIKEIARKPEKDDSLTGPGQSDRSSDETSALTPQLFPDMEIKEIAREPEKGESPIKKTSMAASKRKVLAKANKKQTPEKAVTKPVRKKMPPVDKSDAALHTVFKIIKNSKRGINIDTVMEKTGYGRKKVQNCVYKLNKQGNIKNVSKGMYSAM
ncbi:MAG: hypothetical protein Q8P24_15395 [Desulfobacterales bacterium]|nr:hypothetical protein [Desulfobacterales bacterium]